MTVPPVNPNVTRSRVVLEVAAWNERYYNPKAGHMIDGGWAAGTPEPNMQVLLQYYSKIGLITGANDPILDAAIEKEMSGTTLELRKEALQKVTLPAIAERMPNLVLCRKSQQRDAFIGNYEELAIRMPEF